MDAAPFLVEVGRALRAVELEAVLIGNAGAALQGAPVTTVDFDFLFRKTPRNMRKLKRFAEYLESTVLRPYYPVSDLFRVVRDDGMQVDFMATVHGLRSFEGVRARATIVELQGVTIAVASLPDIIRSKRAAGRPRDLAVVDVRRGRMPKHASRKRPPATRRQALAALKRESVRALDELIARWLALPPHRRTNFLRTRRPFTPGSYL